MLASPSSSAERRKKVRPSSICRSCRVSQNSIVVVATLLLVVALAAFSGTSSFSRLRSLLFLGAMTLGSSSSAAAPSPPPCVVVVGGGLAGLSASIEALDRGECPGYLFSLPPLAAPGRSSWGGVTDWLTEVGGSLFLPRGSCGAGGEAT